MGPLTGLKVIEIAGLGPTPSAACCWPTWGADVLRIDWLAESELGIEFPREYDLRSRNKRSVAIDMKVPEGKAVLLELIVGVYLLIAGFRPGVAERLGIGPEDCRQRNPRLVYGRATGWGQDGPWAQMAGHDINYVALSGALDRIGPPDGAPVPPLNLLGDYAGGGLYLAFGLVSAVLEARNSGQGQVVDAAMVDGAVGLMTVFHAFGQMGQIDPRRGHNLLDGGAPYYRCYGTADGKYMAAGPIEPKFYAVMLEILGLDPAGLPAQNNRARWPELHRHLEAAFFGRTRDEWAALFQGSDACVSPVPALDEVAAHPHNQARGTMVEVGGVSQPRPLPRLSRTPGTIERTAPERGEHTLSALEDWGLDQAFVQAALRAKGLGVAQ